MKRLQLKDLLGYLDHGNSADSETIQIVTESREWDDFEELNASSILLQPFNDYYIRCISAEDSELFPDRHCIRVDIQKEVY